MDKRFFLAIVLAIGVLLLTPKLFPPPPPAVAVPDSAPQATLPATSSATTANLGAPSPTIGAGANQSASDVPISAETTFVATPKGAYRFSSAGAAFIGASLTEYAVLPRRDRPVELGRVGGALVSYRVVQGSDTFDLSHVNFRPDSSALRSAHFLRYDGSLPGGTLSLSYSFAPDSYVVRVRGVVHGVAPAQIGIMLPQGLADVGGGYDRRSPPTRVRRERSAGRCDQLPLRQSGEERRHG